MTNTSTEATVPTTDVDATEKATPASSVEYSAGVVRLGNIKPAAPEVEEATPDITGKGGEDLDKKSFADFGVVGGDGIKLVCHDSSIVPDKLHGPPHEALFCPIGARLCDQRLPRSHASHDYTER